MNKKKKRSQYFVKLEGKWILCTTSGSVSLGANPSVLPRHRHSALFIWSLKKKKTQRRANRYFQQSSFLYFPLFVFFSYRSAFLGTAPLSGRDRQNIHRLLGSKLKGQEAKTRFEAPTFSDSSFAWRTERQLTFSIWTLRFWLESRNKGNSRCFHSFLNIFARSFWDMTSEEESSRWTHSRVWICF